MTDDLCHGYHVWVRRGKALECSRCGFTTGEDEG